MASPTRCRLASAGPGSIPQLGRDGAGEAVLQWYVMAANASPTRGRLGPCRPGGTVLPGQMGSSQDRGGMSWWNTPQPLPCSASADHRCVPVQGMITVSKVRARTRRWWTVDTLLELSVGPSRSGPTVRRGWCRSRVGLRGCAVLVGRGNTRHRSGASAHSKSIPGRLWVGPTQARAWSGSRAPGSQRRGRSRVATSFVAAATLWWPLPHPQAGRAKFVLRVSGIWWCRLILLYLFLYTSLCGTAQAPWGPHGARPKSLAGSVRFHQQTEGLSFLFSI
jgi:hypothetical protein